jgi:HAD superfamily phosphoserine phosphatase-like hydrolase
MGRKEYIVFDFDHTLYRYDCTIRFLRFMLSKHPLLYRYLPLLVFYYVCWKLSVVSTTRFKEKYFSFLNGINPETLENLVAEFWESQSEKDFNQPVNRILEQRISEGHSCVVITASPQLIVSYIVKQLYNIDCIGTILIYKHNFYRIDGKNCKGIEKINRFEQAYGTGATITEAYSDNVSDKFLFEKSMHAFRIRGETVSRVK